MLWGFAESSFSYSEGMFPEARSWITLPTNCSSIMIRSVVGLIATTAIFIPWLNVADDSEKAWKSIAILQSSFTLIGALTLSHIAQTWKGMPYPVGRTGLYFIPLFLLAAAIMLSIWHKILSNFRVRYAFFGAGLILLTHFVLQLSFTSYYDGRDNLASRRVFHQIQANRQLSAQSDYDVITDAYFFPPLEFYRRMYGCWDIRIASRGWTRNGILDDDTTFDLFVLHPMLGKSDEVDVLVAAKQGEESESPDSLPNSSTFESPQTKWTLRQLDHIIEMALTETQSKEKSIEQIEKNYGYLVTIIPAGTLPVEFFAEQIQLAGDFAYANEDFAAAESLYRSAVQLRLNHPDTHLYHYKLGLALANQGKSEEALRHLLITVRRDPQNDDARRVLESLAGGRL